MSLIIADWPTGRFACTNVTARSKDAAIRTAKRELRAAGYRILDVASAIEAYDGRTFRVELWVVAR